MSDATTTPPGVDRDRPSIARVYDYILGGHHNFAADRTYADNLLTRFPGLRAGLRANRAALRRVVRYLATEAGITQFLDIGSGIPTAGNVHEIAQAANPAARVVYIDVEEAAVRHGRFLLNQQKNRAAVAIRADLRDPAAVLAHPEVRGLLDFDKPVALLLFAILHFIPDSEDPYGIVATFRDSLPPGSLLAVSHGVRVSEQQLSAGADYSQIVAPIILRTRDRIEPFFADWPIVPPGVVYLDEWRPDLGSSDKVASGEDGRGKDSLSLVGVATKPA